MSKNKNVPGFERAMFQLLSFPRSVRDRGGYWSIYCVDGMVTVGKESGIVRAHVLMREDKDDDFTPLEEYKYKHNQLPPDDWGLTKENCHRKMAEYLSHLEVLI